MMVSRFCAALGVLAILVAGSAFTGAPAAAQGDVNGAANLGLAVAQHRDKAIMGDWSAPEYVGVEAVHAALLPTGKVIFWFGNWDVRLWDPATGSTTQTDFPWPANIFCSGHVLLADGRLLVMGGTGPSYDGFTGIRSSFFFDPWTETWSRGPDMNVGRWYPTPVAMPDGTVLVFSGLDEGGVSTPVVERFTGDAWEVVEGAERRQSLYPRLHLIPDGRLARAGHEAATVFLEADAASWTAGPNAPLWRWQGSSVLLPGMEKILATGGLNGDWTTASAMVLDLGADPAWEHRAPMSVPRRDHNLVLLPDGTVLATGGATGPMRNVQGLGPETLHDTAAQAGAWMFRYPNAYHAEVYDPVEDRWTPLAAADRIRTYHSTALLLPDARVWTAGSDLETIPGLVAEFSRTIELFSPPYLFRGDAPTIEAAPDRLGYGDTFTVTSPDAADVTRAALIGLGSVTHAFNTGQRYLDLDFSATGAEIVATAPPDARHAPPGWYMLFLVGAEGVPSEGRIIRMG